MSEAERYIFMMDEDAQDYVLPLSKKKEAEEFFAKMDEWIRTTNEDGTESFKMPEQPVWLRRVPNLWCGISFIDPQIEDDH